MAAAHSLAPPMHPDLDRAYRQAHYWISDPDGPLLVEVDRPLAALDALLERRHCTAAALLTAANPGSRQLSAPDNAARQHAMEQRLAATGIACLSARAVDPRGRWPDEHGVLALGLPLDLALGLAGEFGQNAILWCARGQPPRLLWVAPSTGAANLDQHRRDDGDQA